ncbi:hypothetical protein [Chitinophaga silvisoli]|uniref:Uncharacterized protein n=1 Tax=Chitinophaga silvisoli TaxID=2291814 RepID=A0A3E1P345_9BACT|nr:hypothetical protein [Chitinophaga silvisoli]RFM34418.1 hypothetical protein DXN04_14145 [Chitinophaga silvisoli]
MNIEQAFLVTTGLTYEQQNLGISGSAEVFNKRETFENLNEAIIALNNIPNYYFSDALVLQHQLGKSLDYAVIHDSDGIIKITKNYIGWTRDTPPGIYISLHGITTEEFNNSSGQDLISYPCITVGTNTAYRIVSYAQMEKEISALPKRQPVTRVIKPDNWRGKTIK